MIDDFGGDAAPEFGHIGQQLRAAIGGAWIAVGLGRLVRAAAHAGIPFTGLCDRLARFALRDASARVPCSAAPTGLRSRSNGPNGR